MNYKSDSTTLVGATPLVRLSNFENASNCPAHIFAKVESYNPGGSVKDRVALAMIEDAEERGELKPGATIIEPTSGNTGIGLAWVGRLKGYKVILTMPDTMSVERRRLLKAYGATLVLTPGSEGMKGAIAKAEEIHRATPGSFIPGQFSNPANPAVHERTTGPEIHEALAGEEDVLVACVGTGGTITGTGRALKRLRPSVEIVAVEPVTSAVLSGGVAGPHKIQGIGAGFIPENYDSSVVNRVMTVTDDEAFAASRLLASSESILAGISSGAALAAATRLANEPAYHGKNIVVILPDGGERYLSTPLFDDPMSEE